MQVSSLLTRWSRGVTFVEVLVTLGVLAILATFVAPQISNMLPSAREGAAITKAEALNNAMFTYRQRIPDAQANWTSATNDAARYLLLTTPGYLPNTAETFAGYVPPGFTFTFPALLTGRVSITGPDGAVEY